jgi:L-asparaginase
MARVAVVFTGGTISMRHEPGSTGNRPTMRGAELLASVPGLADVADIEPIDWGLVPASHLSMDQVLEIGRILADQLARPEIDGAVVVQGTDVLEETAFAWDLLPLAAKAGRGGRRHALGIAGGLRRPREPAQRGRRGRDPGLADQGVVVAMAGEIHGADDVRKTHTHAYATFQSPNHGRLGSVADGWVHLARRRSPVRLPLIPTRAASPVPLLTVALDDDGAVEAAVARRPAGLVVAATGGGNTPVAYLEGARALLADGIPVALTTRCPSGSARPGYGFPGGSSAWWEAGAIFTGTLDGLKARMLLALGIGAGLTTEDLGAMCIPFGGGVASPHDPE